MDAFFLSGAATATVVAFGIFAVLAVISAFLMRDQPSLKGPVLMIVLALALGGAAWYVHDEQTKAETVAVAERYKFLKVKYGVKVRATDEVTDLEVPGKWRIGQQFRSCHLVESTLTLDDPVVVCEAADGRYQELNHPISR